MGLSNKTNVSKRDIKKGRYLWATPGAEILPDPLPETPGKIYDGAAIASFITAAGYPCTLVNTSTGASVAGYHFNLANVLQVNKVKAVIPALEASLNCDAILGKSGTAHFSITLPRLERQTVHLKTAMCTTTFNDVEGAPACLGTDAQGNTLALDISSLPHMIVSGSTGSGKSVLINSIITSILFRRTPSTHRFILIDPKEVEFTQFSGIPHLYHPIITDTRDAVSILGQLCAIMDQRYQQLRQIGARDVDGTNLPRIIIVIDELADLILTSKKSVEESIIRIAQKGRAAGIHLIISTQQPRAAVLTGLIRANIPCKVALKTATATDSRISLGYNGAEKLLGRGDALLVHPSTPGEFKRFQSAYISPWDIQSVVGYWQSNQAKRPLNR